MTTVEDISQCFSGTRAQVLMLNRGDLTEQANKNISNSLTLIFGRLPLSLSAQCFPLVLKLFSNNFLYAQK